MREGCCTGLRLPHHYNEASFTFTTSVALTWVTVEEAGESGHTLFFTMTPKQGAAGNRQTATIV
jgi:hypothetical protein